MTNHHDAGLESDMAVELTERRKASSLTQSDIAQKLGVTDACISQWEIGACYPKSLAVWKRWASALGADLTIKLES